jgi:YidC/Oxa1 family membrane protein insertase
MDNQRLLVWAAFGMLAFMTYQTWLQDYGPPPVEPAAVSEERPPATEPAIDALPGLPTGDSTTPALPPETAASFESPKASDTAAHGEIVRVSTDVFEVEINTAGGKLQRAVLTNYPIAKDQPDTLVELLSTDELRFASIQSGLIADAGDGEAYFNALLKSDARNYALNGDDELVVPLRWDNGNGVTVEKRFRFRRGSYRIEVEHRVINNSDSNWRAAEYTVLKRLSGPHERSMFNVDTYSFDGPIIYDGSKSEKLKRDDLLEGPYQINAADGWVGGIQHHFLSVIVPAEGEENRYEVNVKGNRSSASVFGGTTTIRPGDEHTFKATLFVGPKVQSELAQLAPSLKLTVDYGFLTILSNPLFWLLSKVFEFVGNWGVAIILVTIVIKMAFYKLTEKSGRSMAKMREIQPRMKALQDRYKDDRQALSQAMMELYKREKVNPAAGCLPILIQMPFFLAFYWVLLESVEMRQAPFALWITDLSSRDPYFILPIIMGAAMLMQQRLNPAPADPVQAKVMQIMPIVFTGFFAFFPSGLVLYWVTNTLLSIAQQWYVNKVVAEEQKTRKGKHQKKSD